MALDVTVLAQAIKDIRNIDHTSGEKTNDELAELLAQAIVDQIKLGDVVIAGGSSSGSYKVT
tara:strand:+ start:3383 stop:3568 length:186 start_codon:yes stop_codon:yes gene_type:complete